MTCKTHVYSWSNIYGRAYGKFYLKSLMLNLCHLMRLKSLILWLVGFMKAKGKVWDEIVVKYGLYKTQIDEIYCFATINNVLHLGFQHVCSMNKSREFGFFLGMQTH